jgi:hypothetical protein
MIAILVLQERWNIIGDIIDNGRESGEVVVQRAHVVRYWGTTKGLGELVQGPTPTTKLDALPSVTGDLYIPYHALVFTLVVEDTKWNDVLNQKQEE